VRVLAVEPSQPACAQAQSISGVLSMASHCGLQYLLLLDEAIVQVQTGWAHFSVFSVAIVFSRPDRKPIIQAQMLVVSLRNNCPQKYTPELCALNQL